VTTDLKEALSHVYGVDPDVIAQQGERYERAIDRFRRLYGPGPVAIWRAPGRVNLIGEHTDYHQGYVLPMALDRDLLLLIRPREDAVVNLANMELAFAPRSFQITTDIPRRPLGDWANYAQGPAQLLARETQRPLRGFDGLVSGAPPWGIPRGAGLSSSSALTVVTALALTWLNEVALSGPALADFCSRAEWYVGTRGGIMDQFTSILAQRGAALFLDCRPTSDGYRYEPIPLPADYALIVIDSKVRHQNTGPLFNRRVAEGRIGVRLLQRRYPWVNYLRDVENLPWEALEPLLPEVIHRDELLQQGIDPDSLLDKGVSPDTDTFYVRRRCAHVVSENRRVRESVAALSAGDVARFGQLMAEAHASARDNYEISTPEIECLVDLATECPGVAGARLTGAGWGGCIVVLAAQSEVERVSQVVSQGYRERTGLQADAFVCQSGPGAGLVCEITI